MVGNIIFLMIFAVFDPSPLTLQFLVLIPYSFSKSTRCGRRHELHFFKTSAGIPSVPALAEVTQVLNENGLTVSVHLNLFNRLDSRDGREWIFLHSHYLPFPCSQFPFIPFLIDFHRRPYNTRTTVRVCDLAYSLQSQQEKKSAGNAFPRGQGSFPSTFIPTPHSHSQVGVISTRRSSSHCLALMRCQLLPWRY